jgi:uridine phosphorylase
VPTRLRPTAPIAAEAILVGDPGRALLLAQELLEAPKMSNHARGLWGYFGHTAEGSPLTIQATGIGGPSAALVLGDLAELGVRRVVRVGTCIGWDDSARPGDVFVVAEAVAAGGSASALGLAAGGVALPDRPLTERLAEELGDRSRLGRVASVDAHPAELAPVGGVDAADMQTAPLLARAGTLAVAAAALLIVAENPDRGEALSAADLEGSEKAAGRAASLALSG